MTQVSRMRGAGFGGCAGTSTFPIIIPDSSAGKRQQSWHWGWHRAGGLCTGSSQGVHPSTARPPAEEVDVMLQRCEGGVDAALQYAKTISKYMKDLIGYLEKRTILGEWGTAGGSFLEQG